MDIKESDEFRMLAGKGIHAKVSGRALWCGNEKFLTENGIVLADAAASA